eukprot:gene5556-9558_t
MAATEVVFLNKDDVPGTKLLKKPSECSVTELKRWLECRGAKESGTKKVLIERVKDCLKIKMKIDPKIEGGKCSDSDYGEKEEFQVATAKPLKKGSNLVKSKFLEDVQDNEGYDSYALRAHIHHSMKKELPLSTQIALSKSSGFVKSAYCTCVAKSLGRCAHVAALLLFLNDYITKNTYHVEVPKTYLSCNWNKGKRRNKNPIELHKDIYNSPKEKVETYFQDLRPVKYRKTDDTLKATFVKDSQTISAAKQELSMWETILHIEDFELGKNDFSIYKAQVDQFVQGKQDSCDSLYTARSSCRVPGTEEQSKSEKWFLERWPRITASECKLVTVLGEDVASEHSSKLKLYNFLYNDFWFQERVLTSDMKYGIEMELIARHAYFDRILGEQKIISSWC